MIYHPKPKSTYFHHCWETWHHVTSSQLPSGCLQGRCSNDVDTAFTTETKIRQADGILNFIDLGGLEYTCLWVSTRPHAKKSTTFMSTKQFQRVTTEGLLISSNWRWYLLQHIVYCSRIIIFTNQELGAPGCSPVSPTTLNPLLIDAFEIQQYFH